MIRTILPDMGHPQPTMSLKVCNSYTNGIINGAMKQCCSKSINIRLYLLKCREFQGKFHIYWCCGNDNLSSYFTKHHSPLHICCVRSKYLLQLHCPHFRVRSSLEASSSYFLRGFINQWLFSPSWFLSATSGLPFSPPGYSMLLPGYPPPISSFLPQVYLFPKPFSIHPQLPRTNI